MQLLKDLANTWEDKLDDGNDRLESDMLQASMVSGNSNGDDPMTKSSDGSEYANEDEVDIVNNARRGTMDKCAMDKMLAYRMTGNSDRKISASAKAERDTSVTTTDELRHEHRHATSASTRDPGRTQSDGPVLAQSQIERGGFDGPVRIIDDGRLLHDDLRRKRMTTTSDAVIHRGTSNSPSYPTHRYNTTVIKSNDSDFLNTPSYPK
ncbi:hypothetical protein THAOC_32181, partial [Thalassiosira oceanica]